MKNSVKVALISIVCVGLSAPVLALQPQEEEKPADENIERITVYGTKSVTQLKREITKKTKSFFKDYNKLNDNRQYAVICRKEKNVGSNFKSTNCEPRFVKTRRSDMMAVQQAGGFTTSLGTVEYGTDANAGAFALSKLKLMSAAARVGVSRNKKFNDHVEQVFSKHPELFAKYKEILELQSEYAYKRLTQ